jgi:hypothetical protein
MSDAFPFKLESDDADSLLKGIKVASVGNVSLMRALILDALVNT